MTFNDREVQKYGVLVIFRDFSLQRIFISAKVNVVNTGGYIVFAFSVCPSVCAHQWLSVQDIVAIVTSRQGAAPWRDKGSAYHTSHDSVSVVRTTFKVYGKRQTLTLSQPKTPKLIVTKFEWRDYVVDIYHQKKNYGLNPFRGFCSPYKRNMHPLFEIHYTFLVLQLVGVGSNSCFSEPRSWAPDWPLSPTSIRLSIISIL